MHNSGGPECNKRLSVPDPHPGKLLHTQTTTPPYATFKQYHRNTTGVPMNTLGTVFWPVKSNRAS